MKFANNSANTNGVASSLVGYDGPCVFFSLHASFSGSAGAVMLFDSRSLPRKGDRPKRQWYIPELTTFDHETANGIAMQNGCVVAISDTMDAYTASANTAILDVVFYVPPADLPPKTEPVAAATLEAPTKPSPPPQRPPPASTPPGRPAPTSKPLKATVAAFLAFLLCCSSGWAASSTTPGSSGGGVSVKTNGYAAVPARATGINFVDGNNTTVFATNDSGTVSIRFDSTGSGSGGTNGGVTVSNANTIYVAIDGNNATARRGRPDLAYRDPRAAVLAAVSGDTIKVGPGVFITNNLAKNLVNWDTDPGTVFAYTNQLGDGGCGIFDDRFGGGAITSSISAFNFVYSIGTQSVDVSFAPCCGPTNVLGCYVKTNPLSQITFKFDRIGFLAMRNLAGPAAIYLLNGTNGITKGNLIEDLGLGKSQVIGYDTDVMEDVVVGSVATGVYWGAGNDHCDVKRNLASFYGVYTHGVGTNLFGDFHYTSDFTYGKFYSDGTFAGPDWRVWYTVNEGKTDATNNGSIGNITLLGAGKIYITGKKFGERKGTTGTALLMNSSGGGSPTCWLNAQKVSAMETYFDLGGGTLHANVLEFENLGNVLSNGFHMHGGTLNLQGAIDPGLRQVGNVAHLSKYLLDVPVLFSNTWVNFATAGYKKTTWTRDWKHAWVEGFFGSTGDNPPGGGVAYVPWGYRSDAGFVGGSYNHHNGTGPVANAWSIFGSMLYNVGAWVSIASAGFAPLNASYTSTAHFIAVANPNDANVCLLIPPNCTNATTLVVYFHAGAETNTATINFRDDDAVGFGSNWVTTLKGCLTNGWPILSHSAQETATLRGWGNAASVNDYSNAVGWATRSLAITNVVFLASSMGGVPALNLFAQMPTVSKLYLDSAVCSLSNTYWFIDAAFSNSLNTAFSTTAGAFNADTAGYDPLRFPTNVYGTRPIRLAASGADTVVATNYHAHAWTNRFNSSRYSVTNTTGAHAGAGTVVAADIINFFR